jgi:8-oxo-dGTP pyrophosphatase MutT (NUDIX family)
MSAAANSPTVLVDYKNKDWRGFLFVIHESHGLLLLYCTRKTSKGPHFQTPGGHVDEIEFLNAARVTSSPDSHLLQAAMAGAVRELYEETGMDMRKSLHRIEPVQLYTTKKGDTLDNEYKSRLFFKLVVNDADFPESGVAPMGNAGISLKVGDCWRGDNKASYPGISHEHYPMRSTIA